MEVVLYSTDCPKCKMLEKRMADNGIEFSKSTDIDKMIDLGFMEAPVLEVDGKHLGFMEAYNWINSSSGEVM